MTDAPELAPLWHRPIEVAVGEAVRVRVGPQDLTIERRAHEWRVAPQIDPSDPLRDERSIERVAAGDDDAEDAAAEIYRYAFSTLPERFELRPRLADRNVVVRPTQPLRLVGHAAVDLFVSTPLWLAMVLLPGDKLLFDAPTVRPSDTWFGADTRNGELCYASRTRARLEIDHLARPAGRAITRMRVVNLSPSTVSLERVLLPAPQLALFEDPAGDLWTQPVEIELSQHEEAKVTVLDAPSLLAPDATLLAPARRPPDRTFIARAFSALWR